METPPPQAVNLSSERTSAIGTSDNLIYASAIGRQKFEQLFPEVINYINCPKRSHLYEIEGNTEDEVVDFLIKQLSPAKLKIQDSAGAANVFEQMPVEITDYVEVAVAFTEVLHGIFVPSDQRNDELKILEAVEAFKDNPITRGTRNTNEVMKQKSNLYLATKSLLETNFDADKGIIASTVHHNSWLNFLLILMGPVILEQHSYHGMYSVRKIGETSLDFTVSSIIGGSHGRISGSRDVNFTTIRSKPDAMFSLNKGQIGGFAEYPFLVIEMKSSSQRESNPVVERVESWLDDVKASNADSSGTSGEPAATSCSSADCISPTRTRKGRGRKRKLSRDSETPTDAKAASSKSPSSPISNIPKNTVTDLGYSDIYSEIRTRHFLELLSTLKSVCRKNLCRPLKVFGLYVVMSKVYITCLTLENTEGVSEQLISSFMTCPFNFSGPIKYKLVCTDCLDILKPVHCRAFLRFLHIIMYEQMHITYLPNP